MIDLKPLANQLYEMASWTKNDRLIQLATFLCQRIYHPDSYVVMLGETCCGKSTLLNSVVGEGILPVSAVPSTGAVTEVVLDSSVKEISYAVINRNATMELLDREQFCDLVLQPDSNVQRLRVTLPAQSTDTEGIRFFDTPGYDSLIQQHKEVLEEFLPECDAVVYVVAYRSGIQKSDFQFLQTLKEQIRPEVPIYLVINRCPAGLFQEDRRIAEICRDMRALLMDQELPLFTIPSTSVTEGYFESSDLQALRNKIVRDLHTPRRQQELYGAFLQYLQELAGEIRIELECRLRNVQLSMEEAQELQRRADQWKEKFQYAVDNIVKPGFAKIHTGLPARVSLARQNMENKLCAEIEKQAATSKNEMQVYTQYMLVPSQAKEAAKEIQYYLSVELRALNEAVDDYLSTAVVELEQDIKLQNSSAAFTAGSGILKNGAGRLLNAGLTRYFAQYGGAGGAGAGMANAASHFLKKGGELFGKTFSRKTHNAVKQVMKKIGLTSTKTLSQIAGGAVEAAFMIADLATWKLFLVGKIKKSLSEWEKDMLGLTEQDLNTLEKDNIQILTELKDETVKLFDVNEVPGDDINLLQQQLKSLDEIEKELGE